MAFHVRPSVDPKYTPTIRFEGGGEALSWKYNDPGIMYRIDPDDVPRVALHSTGSRVVPDFVPINGWRALSSEAHALIVELEPDVHQFFPVAIRPKNPERVLLRSNKKPLTEPYFVMNIQSAVDAVCIERSDVDVKTMNGQQYVNARPVFNVVLWKHLTSGHHIWRGRYQCRTNTFVSDVLGKEIIGRKWKGITLTLVEEI